VRAKVDKDYFFDKEKVQLFFTLEFHAAVRGEKVTFLPRGCGLKKSNSSVKKNTFFHTEITFFPAGITFFHAAPSSVKKSNFSVKKILFFTLASMKKRQIVPP
jgi:hypothetical protein